MPRPKKTATPDLTQAVDLTAGVIDRLVCPPGKQQAFLRDAKAPGLRVRVTAAGAKSFIFEAKLNRQNIRRTIGDVRAWGIDQARAEANRLRVTLDGGNDPRELERQQKAQKSAQMAASAAQLVIVAEAWGNYLSERQPHWGERHYADHVALARPGGKSTRRGTQGRGTTLPGPLYPFMAMLLRDIDPERVEAWASAEAKARPTQARLALRVLRAFLNWCADDSRYRVAVGTRNATSSRKARETLGKAKPKQDALLREQLAAWFAAVRALRNPAPAAYLQTLLLTGARPGEVLALRWDDLNLQWRGMTIRDKVDGERVIPLTPYVAQLLAGLPHHSEWIFAGVKHSQPMSRPHRYLLEVSRVAGIEGLTLHGLRRSFGTLSEWLDIPAGVVAQIQGHKPSATAEKHYRVRPLDLLRVHHERIEAWVLDQAGLPMPTAVKSATRAASKK